MKAPLIDKRMHLEDAAERATGQPPVIDPFTCTSRHIYAINNKLLGSIVSYTFAT